MHYLECMTNTEQTARTKVYTCNTCGFSCNYQSGDRKHGRKWASQHSCIPGNVTVKVAIHVYEDASGAPCVLECNGFTFAFDMLGHMTRNLIGHSGIWDGRQRALVSCTLAYETTLRNVLPFGWEQANESMYHGTTEGK